MNTQNPQFVIRETPIGLRIFGAIFAGVGAFFLLGVELIKSQGASPSAPQAGGTSW